MSERSRLRLFVLQVLVLSLLMTLLGRLYYLQVLAQENYVRAAAENRTREIVTPAARGMILDSAGRPLARNHTALVVSIGRTEMLRQRDGGRELVARVAAVIDQPFADVWAKTRLCGTPGAEPAPRCWNGSPYQPIPVTDEADTAMALQIMERREDFPGVTAELTAVREYPAPLKANAAHMLGYLGRSQENADLYTPDGFSRSGDLGVMDADGYVRVTGRTKDIVIRGGMNISVREVEDLLAAHPAIRAAAVVGMPDPRVGERVCCYVVPVDPAAIPTLDDLKAYLTERGVAVQKAPEHLEVVDGLPMTLTGKVQKHLLRRDIASKVAAPAGSGVA